jgi:type VI secretion system secreted protein Hcp
MPGGGVGTYDVFMKIGDISGESVDDKHRDWIEVLSFNWEATQALTGGTIAAQDFSFVLKVDKSSPLLFKYFATGGKIDNAIIAVRKAGDRLDFMEYKLTDVIVSSFSPATHARTPSQDLQVTGGVPGAITNVVQATTGGTGDAVAAAGFNFRAQKVKYTVLALDGSPVSFELNFSRGDIT